MNLYKCQYNLLEDGSLNINSPIKFMYSDGRSLDYQDPAIIFQAISWKDTIIFLSNAIDKKTYMEEYKSFTFGERIFSSDLPDLKPDELNVFYIDTDYTITKKLFYELCLLMCQAKLNCIRKFELKEIVDDNYILKLEELFSIFSNMKF
jgi:hypothetical protein